MTKSQLLPRLRFAFIGLGLSLMLSSPAFAIDPNQTTYGVNFNIAKQMTEVPQLFKQLTVIASIVTALSGIQGFYKGMQDPRSAAPVKNAFLLLIGGMLMSISYVALTAEKSVFGTNDTNVHITGKTSVSDKMNVFK